MTAPTTEAGRALLDDWNNTRTLYEAPSWSMLMDFAGRAIEATQAIEAEAAAAALERIAARLPTPRPDIEPMRDPVWQGQISGYNAALRDVRAILAEPTVPDQDKESLQAEWPVPYDR